LKISCKLLTNDVSKIDEFIENIFKIGKNALIFMIKKGIPLTPLNYKNVFLSYCYLIETLDSTNDANVMSIYETLSKDDYQSFNRVFDDNEKELLNNIIYQISYNLVILYLSNIIQLRYVSFFIKGGDRNGTYIDRCQTKNK